MWHRDFEQGAILVPDFEGYPPWIAVGDDRPREAVRLQRLVAHLHAASATSRTPTRARSASARTPRNRRFRRWSTRRACERLSTAPFVNHVMPLMVTYVLTFAILLFMVKDDERSFNILSALTGLFFLTLLNHQQINTVASADGLSFLGLASGIMYVTFFGVAANGLARRAPRHSVPRVAEQPPREAALPAGDVLRARRDLRAHPRGLRAHTRVGFTASSTSAAPRTPTVDQRACRRRRGRPSSIPCPSACPSR